MTANGKCKRPRLGFEATLVLPRMPRCAYCGAYKFYKETIRFCCSEGEVSLAEHRIPQILVDLLTGNDAQAKEFQNQIRTYNNHFAFTSIGIYCDEQYQRRDRGIYTVRVQGRIYHFLNDLLPQDSTKGLKGVQFYFYDPEHQLQNRLSQVARLDHDTSEIIVTLLLPNPYSEFLKYVSSLKDIETYNIVIRSEPGLDQRTFNKPTSTEVAGIWLENEDSAVDFYTQWDIRVHTKSGQSLKVQYYYGCYDPLQYVLMFHGGEPGWHANISRLYVGKRNTRECTLISLSTCQPADEPADMEIDSYDIAARASTSSAARYIHQPEPRECISRLPSTCQPVDQPTHKEIGKMGESTMLIPQITSEINNWTARITIVEYICEMRCANGSELKRYIFVDTEGNEVAASLYGRDIKTLSPVLQLYKVYDIANAHVTFTRPEYRILANSVQWVLRHDTLIRPLPAEVPNVRYLLDSLTPYGLIREDLKTVDVMGVAIASSEIREATRIEGTSKVMAITLVNTERIPIILRVWDPITTDKQSELEAVVEHKNVIIAKRLKISIYKGISVATKNSSSITINPPSDGCRQLKSWFDSVREAELQTFMSDNSINLSIQLVQKGAMKIYSILELQNAKECRDYWVRGYLDIADQEQTFFYIGCNNCSSKINISEGTEYPCWVCKQAVVASLRPIVKMTITDNVNHLIVAALENVAELILQSTAVDIARMLKLGQRYDVSSLRAELQNKIHIMLIRQTSGKLQDQKRLLLVTYFEAPNSSTPNTPAPSTEESAPEEKSDHFTLSPLKRQLSHISIAKDISAKKRLMPKSDESTSETPSEDQHTAG